MGAPAASSSTGECHAEPLAGEIIGLFRPARIAWSVLRNNKPFDIHRHEVTAI